MLRDFRCHDSLSLRIGPQSVALTGGNGVGKTSLLEALSLLAPGRGLRRARLAEIGRWPAPGQDAAAAWSVAVRLLTPAGEVDVGTGIEPGPARERRQIRIDGRPARGQSSLSEVCSILWLTPEMDRLFTDTPSARRRFLDRIVFGLAPEHAASVSAYERAMRERVRLLTGGGADPVWLRALEHTMAEEGTAIAVRRRQVARRLSDAATADAFPRAAVDVRGTLDDWLAAGAAPGEVSERFAAALAAHRPADGAPARVGPHRSDVVVRDAASGLAARDCSTGQQKALLIALILAAARLVMAQRSMTPLLLLDEVAAHLDPRHRRQLFDAVDAIGCQAWYAGTDAAVFQPLLGRAQIIAVEDLIAGDAPARAKPEPNRGAEVSL